MLLLRFVLSLHKEGEKPSLHLAIIKAHVHQDALSKNIRQLRGAALVQCREVLVDH